MCPFAAAVACCCGASLLQSSSRCAWHAMLTCMRRMCHRYNSTQGRSARSFVALVIDQLHHNRLPIGEPLGEETRQQSVSVLKVLTAAISGDADSKELETRQVTFQSAN